MTTTASAADCAASADCEELAVNSSLDSDTWSAASFVVLTIVCRLVIMSRQLFCRAPISSERLLAGRCVVRSPPAIFSISEHRTPIGVVTAWSNT